MWHRGPAAHDTVVMRFFKDCLNVLFRAYLRYTSKPVKVWKLRSNPFPSHSMSMARRRALEAFLHYTEGEAGRAARNEAYVTKFSLKPN